MSASSPKASKWEYQVIARYPDCREPLVGEYSTRSTAFKNAQEAQFIEDIASVEVLEVKTTTIRRWEKMS